MKQVIFLSHNKNYTTYVDVDGKQVEIYFNPSGGIGIYKTDKEEIINALRNHPKYEKNFSDKSSFVKLHNTMNNVIQGMRASTVNVEEIEAKAKSALMEKFKRYDGLKSTVIKASGEKRVDASEEDYSEFQKLKTELNL